MTGENPAPPQDGRQAASMTRRDMVLYFCIGLFMVSMVVAAVTASKIQTFSMGGMTVMVPAGTLAFALTYLATDVISEVWGRAHAVMVVLVGLIMRFLMLGLFIYALRIEDSVGFIGVADNWTADRQAAFVSVLESSNRINIAGIIAFGFSALTDVAIFHHLRQRDLGKNRLWLRNNLSTIASQILNSIVFISAAFGGTVPMAALGSLILGQLIVKVLAAAIDTPAIYLLRNLAEGRRIWDVSG